MLSAPVSQNQETAANPAQSLVFQLLQRGNLVGNVLQTAQRHCLIRASRCKGRRQSSDSKDKGGLTRKNGDHFRDTLLSRGGSDDAITLFKNFSAKAPHVEPLLIRLD